MDGMKVGIVCQTDGSLPVIGVDDRSITLRRIFPFGYRGKWFVARFYTHPQMPVVPEMTDCPYVRLRRGRVVVLPDSRYEIGRMGR